MSAQYKVATLGEAAKFVVNGALLALGGAERGQPAAFAAELVRQRRQNLRLVGYFGGFAADLLIRAGCGRADYLPAISINDQVRLAPGQATPCGPTAPIVRARLQAAAMSLPFLPVEGSDVPDGSEAVTDPYTGQAVSTVPALSPDVAVIHADAADRNGNVLITDGRRDMVPADILLARAAKTVLVTVEQIVSDRTIATRPQDLALRADEVSAVIEAPYGAHPTGFSNRYRVDEQALADYRTAITSETSMERWLAEWIAAPRCHTTYLEKLGTRRLMEIALSRRSGLR